MITFKICTSGFWFLVYLKLIVISAVVLIVLLLSTAGNVIDTEIYAYHFHWYSISLVILFPLRPTKKIQIRKAMQWRTESKIALPQIWFLRVNLCQFYTKLQLNFCWKILMYRFFLSQNNCFVFNWTVNIIYVHKYSLMFCLLLNRYNLKFFLPLSLFSNV